MNTYLKTSLLWLIPMFGIVSLHFWAYAGHFGYDDIGYARLAQQLLDGTFVLDNDHYAYRWGLITLTALSYKCFGINDFASAMPAWIITLLTLTLVNKLTIRYSFTGRLMIACLYSFHFWTLFYADKLMPDTFVAFAVLASFYIYYTYRFTNKEQTNVQSSILFSLAIWLAILSKETIILLIPVYLFLFLADIIQKRAVPFWIYTILFTLGLGIIYISIITYVTGSPYQRLLAMQAGSYFNPCSYDQLPIINTLRRIGYELWLTWIRSGTIVGIILGVLPLLKFKVKEIVSISNPILFFPTVTLLGVLAAQYTSILPTSYVPMCPDVRHFLYLAPLAAIGALGTLMDFWNNQKQQVILLTSALFCTVVSYYFKYEWTYWLYIPLLIFVLVRFIPMPNALISKLSPLAALAFITILYMPVIQNGIYTNTLHYKQRPIAIHAIFKNNNAQNIAIGNTVMCNLGSYYLQFDSTHTRFKTYQEFAAMQPIDTNVTIYLLDDWLTEYLSNTDKSKLPDYVQRIDTSFADKVYDYKDMRIWKIKDKQVVEGVGAGG